MDKTSIFKTIADYISQQDDILFAYVYGSSVKADRYRDVDVAVYSEKPRLLKLGRMQADLAKATGTSIDLTYLNDLPAKNPAFAYEIMTKGECLHNIASEKHDNYKLKTFLFYFDTRRLREKMDDAFQKRLHSDNFGNRNYA